MHHNGSMPSVQRLRPPFVAGYFTSIWHLKTVNHDNHFVRRAAHANPG
jgi:hypothetical protein